MLPRTECAHAHDNNSLVALFFFLFFVRQNGFHLMTLVRIRGGDRVACDAPRTRARARARPLTKPAWLGIIVHARELRRIFSEFPEYRRYSSSLSFFRSLSLFLARTHARVAYWK